MMEDAMDATLLLRTLGDIVQRRILRTHSGSVTSPMTIDVAAPLELEVAWRRHRVVITLRIPQEVLAEDSDDRREALRMLSALRELFQRLDVATNTGHDLHPTYARSRIDGRLRVHAVSWTYRDPEEELRLRHASDE